MKRYLILATASAFAVFLTSCGVNTGLFVNQNQSATQVLLASNNFKVVDRVTGSSSVKYICLIGGMNKRQLYAHAYADMVAKANLKDGAKAVTNVVTEEHVGGVPPFYYVRTVTVSCHVIEFTK